MSPHIPSTGNDGPVHCVMCGVAIRTATQNLSNGVSADEPCPKREGYVRARPAMMSDLDFDLGSIGSRMREIRREEDAVLSSSAAPKGA